MNALNTQHRNGRQSIQSTALNRHLIPLNNNQHLRNAVDRRIADFQSAEGTAACKSTLKVGLVGGQRAARLLDNGWQNRSFTTVLEV
ncbi:hypothetical protein CFPU101_46420 [Chroococcus sp. FPU101]|nr:hypothetical protein CFPU101_46420 [Chroococcus sp. FPU101]